MKKALSLFFFLIAFFLFVPKTYAQDLYHFTASNINYDPNTSRLSFDISNVEHGPIPWGNNSGGMAISIYSENEGQYGGGTESFSNLTPYCTATHCSVILYHSPGESINPLTPNSDVNIFASGISYNGVPAWTSQTFKFGCIEPSTNTSPQVNPLTGATIYSTDTYLENGSFLASNTNATTWTAMVDYGDGVSGLQSLTLSGANFSLSNVYSNLGTYTAAVCVVDDQNGVGKTTFTINVDNPPPPQIDPFTILPDSVQLNSPIAATATFTDPVGGSSDTATWDWGDGTTSQGTVNETNGVGTVSGNHVYPTVGVFKPTLMVTDQYGVSGYQSSSQYIYVYNPTAKGLFTANKTFSSAAGYYYADPNVIGKVTFNLSYKYNGTQPIATKPFTMDFPAANLSFKATTVSTLVISNTMALVRGNGTINGTGNYYFLFVGDSSTEKVRVQIKDQTGNKIYETQGSRADFDDPRTPVNGKITVK